MKKMTEKKIPTLTMIQAELKAPKNQLNSFGHYKYRNAEDIMQGVKPLLAKYGASLYIAEDLEVIQDRIIVTESAVYKDDSGEVIVKGHAPVSIHKGMSDEQAWGTASSYATKYALSKLFLLDDSQDVDSMDNRQAQTQQVRQRQTPQQKALHDAATAKMEAMQAAKQEAANTIVDANGTTLLQLFAEAMQAGKGSPKSQELDAWAHQSKENLALVQRIAATGAWK